MTSMKYRSNLFRSVRVVGLFVCLGLFEPVVHPVLGQNVRTPALNLEFRRAETAWRSGASVLEAKARVDRVLRELPEDADALKLRANVLLTMKRPEEAAKDARQAVELRPDDGEARILLAESARLSGDMETARKALDEAADLILDDAGLHVRMSWNAMEMGEIEKAEAYARIAVALDAGEASAYYQLARVFLRAGKPDLAAEILARGLKLSVLDIFMIRNDPTLSDVSGHRLLADYTGR